MKQVILFFDTNKLFSVTRSWQSGSDTWKQHEITLLAQQYSIIVSVFVLLELQRVLFRKVWLTISIDQLILMCWDVQITIIASDAIDHRTYHCVYDEMDAQILSDAYHGHADYLITENIKDFNIWEIKEKFWIIVTKNL